jgi:hypothetical protein
MRSPRHQALVPYRRRGEIFSGLGSMPNIGVRVTASSARSSLAVATGVYEVSHGEISATRCIHGKVSQPLGSPGL